MSGYEDDFDMEYLRSKQAEINPYGAAVNARNKSKGAKGGSKTLPVFQKSPKPKPSSKPRVRKTTSKDGPDRLGNRTSRQ